MKNACIVLRNTRDTVGNIHFTPIVDAFLAGGYFFREIILLDYEEVEGLHENVRRLLSSSDFICIVADAVLLEGLADNLSGTFSLSYKNGLFVGCDPAFCLLPTGAEGERRAKEEIVPLLNGRTKRSFDRMVLRMVCAPGETVKGAIDRAYAVSGDRLIYHFTEHYGDQKLEALYDSEVPKMLADNVLRILLEELKDYVYTMDDTPLETRVYEGLNLRRWKLSVAESFTGGGIAARLTRVPGVSSVYFEGLNTYDEEAKIRRLGVQEFTLKHYGAVSAQTAKEMAEGLFATSRCDICVATTGLAGPTSDLQKHPVGLCYIAVGLDGEIYVDEYRLTGDRECITQTAINRALFSVYKLIQ